ncbi:hypothetical protein DFS33DRAFT_1248917, partial [Desarmillaria ectypa]
RVPIIAGLLPVLMHASLTLFLIGLSVFLYPLSVSPSWKIGAITVLSYTVYLITIILPILSLQCPCHTPLSDHLYFAPTISPITSWLDSINPCFGP